MILRHEASYQDYQGKAVLYRRSTGFNPEPGWIDLDMSQVKKIEIVPRTIPWRAVNGFEWNGALSILAWSKGGGGTATTPKAIPHPEGGGFEMFGDLTLKTFRANENQPFDQITYRDVYVDKSGLEEISQDLAEIQNHDIGTIRVPLTDVRKWYAEYGPFFGRINYRLHGGKWDKDSLKDGKDTPWSAQEAIRYLFSQLPGSPIVESQSDLYSMTLDAPSDIAGEGEPVVEHLHNLLKRYGLVPQMLPSGNYLVSRATSSKVAFGQVPAEGGKTKKGKHLSYERKTVTLTDRPPGVLVSGQRRVPRITIHMTPCLRDEDGNVYTLPALMRRWGWSMTNLNQQVPSTDNKRFYFVPAADGIQHKARKDILSMAYRMYAPAGLFDGNGKMIDPKEDLIPILPMREAAWYVKELKRLDVGIPKDAKKGDAGEYVILPPMVRAKRITDQLYSDFKEIKKRFDEKIRSMQSGELTALRQLERDYSVTIKKYAERLAQANDKAASNYNVQEFRAEFLVLTARGDLVEIDKDVRDAANEVGVELGVTLQDRMDEQSWTALATIPIYAKLRNDVRTKIQALQQAIAKKRKEFEEFRKIYEKRKGIPGRFTSPQGFLEDGSFSLDKETGILTSADLLAEIDKPIVLDGDSAEVVADGDVIVTYGYELRENTISAFTSFLFTPEDSADGSTATPKLVGCSRSSPIKAKAIPMRGRMYLHEEGTPVNFNEVAAEAYAKAAPELAQPVTRTGFVAEYSGFQNMPLDAGVSSVQHEWQGGKAATHLAVNAPNARSLPAGPPFLTELRSTVAGDLREILERRG